MALNHFGAIVKADRHERSQVVIFTLGNDFTPECRLRIMRKLKDAVRNDKFGHFAAALQECNRSR